MSCGCLLTTQPANVQTQEAQSFSIAGHYPGIAQVSQLAICSSCSQSSQLLHCLVSATCQSYDAKPRICPAGSTVKVEVGFLDACIYVEQLASFHAGSGEELQGQPIIFVHVCIDAHANIILPLTDFWCLHPNYGV